jgi:hypothetical protein
VPSDDEEEEKVRETSGRSGVVAVDSEVLNSLVQMVATLGASQALLLEQVSAIQREMGLRGEKREMEDAEGSGRPETRARLASVTLSPLFTPEEPEVGEPQARDEEGRDAVDGLGDGEQMVEDEGGEETTEASPIIYEGSGEEVATSPETGHVE